MNSFIELDGQKIPVQMRQNAQARRLILRLNPKEDGVVVTLPKGISPEEGLKMAARNKVWIANQLAKLTPGSRLGDGSVIALRGIDHTLRHRPNARGTVWCEGYEIFITGEMEFFQRRLVDWLKKQAKADIQPQAHVMAAQLDKQVKRISVRDTVSRWGSCSSAGNLSFNWRLIMAPPEILRYVVAHEVSHLRHMDHSADFWATVDGFDVDAKKSRHWLKKHGTALQRIC
ncbi:M48 family metallopeptidase [Terasakiella sp.]|uniref:M48 family metallopeptidase n=1 Tax=Terasakiella sp. TaxID=2034861 RepID=UPI003AA9980F